jgi:DNA-binding PadR family transcriptional regulator
MVALPSQIYPELARLEKQGVVTHQVVEQHDHRPDKKVYEKKTLSALLVLT